jgi:hypothetical protein
MRAKLAERREASLRVWATPHDPTARRPRLKSVIMQRAPRPRFGLGLHHDVLDLVDYRPEMPRIFDFRLEPHVRLAVDAQLEALACGEQVEEEGITARGGFLARCADEGVAPTGRGQVTRERVMNSSRIERSHLGPLLQRHIGTSATGTCALAT